MHEERNNPLVTVDGLFLVRLIVIDVNPSQGGIQILVLVVFIVPIPPSKNISQAIILSTISMPIVRN